MTASVTTGCFLCTKTRGEIEANEDLVFWSPPLFDTHSFLTSYNVDFEARMCSCRWQVTRIPCSHELTVFREKELQDNNIAMNTPSLITLG